MRCRSRAKNPKDHLFNGQVGVVGEARGSLQLRSLVDPSSLDVTVDSSLSSGLLTRYQVEVVMLSDTARIPAVKIMTAKHYPDERGFLLQSWVKQDLEAAGIPSQFKQAIQTYSKRGVVRGLHVQWGPPMGEIAWHVCQARENATDEEGYMWPGCVLHRNLPFGDCAGASPGAGVLTPRRARAARSTPSVVDSATATRL